MHFRPIENWAEVFLCKTIKNKPWENKKVDFTIK